MKISILGKIEIFSAVEVLNTLEVYFPQVLRIYIIEFLSPDYVTVRVDDEEVCHVGVGLQPCVQHHCSHSKHYLIILS